MKQVEIITKQSALTELTFSSPTAAAYKVAVEGLMKQYAVVFGIPERDGKLYVNLEDLLRFCNQVESDSTIASLMYNTLKEYLKTDEARKKFITTDENIDANNFLANVDKSEEVRRNERLESYVADVRVDITSIPNEAETQEERDAFYKAIDELDRMDKLTMKRVGGRMVLQDSKGRTVGSLAIPKVNPSTGGLSTSVEGWIYDTVMHNDGRIDSGLRDLFVRWLEEETPVAKELNNIIYEYAYGNPTAERRAELIEAFAKNAEIVNAKNNGFVASVDNNELLIKHLAKLWRYVNNSGTNRRIQDIRIKSSVNLFFQKGYNSFANSLKLSKNPDGFEITVSQVTEGQLIKATNDSRNIKEYVPANQAIAGGVNPDIHKIGIASATSRDTIITSGIGNQHYRNAARNAISVTLPTRSGYNEYVQAAIANVNDDYVSRDAKEIVQEVQNQIYQLLNAYINSPSDNTFSDIENFLLQVFDNRKGNSSLLYGLQIVISGVGSNRTIAIYNQNSSNSIFIHKQNGKYTANRIQANNVNYELNKQGHRGKTIEISDKDGVILALKDIFVDARFNVKPEFIESDNVSNMALRGLASRREGKFEIKVGDKTWTYNTFNEFILNNNLVRLNTKPNADGTSNYNRVSTESQRRNQTLRVAINSKTTSPVEGYQPAQPVQPATPAARPLNERLVSVLNSTEDDKASAIFRELLGLNFDEETTTETPTEQPVEPPVETPTETSTIEQEETKPKRQTYSSRRARFKGFK